MLQTCQGIVLHQLKYSDSSVIAKIYTLERGLQSYMVKGVRSKKGRHKAVALQPLSLVEVVANYKPGNQLQTLREIRLSKPFSTIPFDEIKRTMALFLTEILYKTIREEEGNPDLYTFLSTSIEVLDAEDQCNNFHLWFLMRLTQYLGFSPISDEQEEVQFFDLREGAFGQHKPLHDDFLEGPSCLLFQRILGTKFAVISELEVSNVQRREILQKIILYFRLHLEGMQEIKSHQVLETVLAP